MIQGKFKKEVGPSRVPLFVDVRDIALAHVRAIEREEAQGKRFFVTAGFFRNSEVVDIIKKNFPDLVGQFPDKYETLPKEFPFKYDNSRSRSVLGLEYRSLEESITDLVKSLKEAGA